MSAQSKHLYYAKTTERQKTLGKGVRLYNTTREEQATPVILSDFEVGEIEGNLYLLCDKSAAELLGCTPRRPQGYSYFYQTMEGVYASDGNGNLEYQFTVEQGARCDKGVILYIGDRLTAVRQPNGIIRNFLKSELHSPAMSLIDTGEIQKAQSYLGELQKALHYDPKRPKPSQQQPATPKVTLASLMPKAKPVPSPAAGAPSSSSTPAPAGGQQPKRGIFDKFLSGRKQAKAQIPKEPDAHEGMTKLFGVGDLRTLMRASNGELRWMSTDEVQEELRRRGRERREAEGKSHQFKVGQQISFGGQKVTVKDHSPSVIAFEREDGSTGTFKVSEYNQKDEQRQYEDQLKAGKKKIEKYAIEAELERKQREQQKKLGFVPSTKAEGETFHREAEAIRSAQTSSPEYEKWQKDMESRGFKAVGTMEMEKDEVEYDTGTGITIKGRMRQLWNSEKKTFDPLFNDTPVAVSYEGKKFQIADINEDKLTIKNVESGDVQDIDLIDLDKFNGTLKIDDEGNVSVEQAGRALGEFEPAEGISQSDLLSEGTIKIIRDEVWKRTAPKDGAVFNDTYLGRIANGVAFYRHGDETGILEEGRRGSVVNRKNVRRDVPKDKMSAGLKSVQKLVVNTQGRLQEQHKSEFDLNVVKAKLEAQTAKPQRPVDRMKYKDPFEKFVGSEKDMKRQIAESYGKPEWSATVDSLAQIFKIEDGLRTAEVEAFNALSKSGILKAPPEEHPVSDYREAAEDLLRGYRDEYLRSEYQESAAQKRAGKSAPKFDWGETSEIPTNAKAAQTQPFKIRDSRNHSYQVTYAIVPMDSVQASHSMEGQINAEHPVELQARKRENPMSVQQMRNIAMDINDDVVTDNADATRGAPVAFSRGGKVFIVQGNGRTAGIKGTAGEQRQKYFGMVLSKAKALGLPTENITENDMLVRVMTGKHTYEDARQLAAYGQESSALPYSEVEYARAYQNAQRLPFQHSVNLEGIGNKPIDESNVGTFIKNNPELYRKIVEQSGKTVEAIQSFPAEQAKMVNTAMLAQLNNQFIEDIAGRDDRTHLLVKRLAPTLIDNQKQVTEGKLPEIADLQTWLQRTVKAYDSLDSGTKNAMNIKAGKSEFLDPTTENPNSLVHKMKQEDLMSAAGREENVFRDPLHVIGLMAYNQAVSPKQTAVAQEMAMTQLALKFRRFNEALRNVSSEQEDIFGAGQTPEQKEASRRDQILKIAELIFLQNKPYRSGEEQLTPEEQEASKEQVPALDVLKKMRGIASSHGFALSGEQLSKAIQKLGKFFPTLFGTLHQRQRAIIKRLPPQTELFTPQEGETRSFGVNDLRKFDAQRRRWVDADEYNKTHKIAQHTEHRQQITEHTAKTAEQAKLQKEPQLSKYFNFRPDTKLIPLSELEMTHEIEPEKKERATKFMRTASLNLGKKRNPINVVDDGQKKQVVDGNTTVDVLKSFGIQQIPVTVLDRIEKENLPQFIEAYNKLQEVAKTVDKANINYLSRPALKKTYEAWSKTKSTYPKLAGKRLFSGDAYDLIFDDDGKLDIVKQFHSVERQQLKLWKKYDRPKELRNAVKDNKGEAAVDELRTLAEKNKANFETLLKAVCKKAGIDFNQESFDHYVLKSKESLNRKIHSAEKEQKLALYGAQYVNDALRYTVEVENWQDVQNIYDQFIDSEKENHFKVLDDTVDNKFDNPTDIGYRDLSMVLRLNDEITAEIQINFKPLMEAKRGEGHKMYKQIRELRQKLATATNPDEINQEREQIASLIQRSKQLYDSIFNQLMHGQKQEEFSLALRKAIDSFLTRLFKALGFKEPQMDLFGAKQKTSMSGVRWQRETGQEKPNHKYIRRYKGKDGEWRYVYRNPEGTEYVGDEKGKELPRHHDWQIGDEVTYNGERATIEEIGEKKIAIKTKAGTTIAVSADQLEHYTETQKKLLGSRAPAVEKYQSLIDEYEEDLKRGEESKQYEYADSRAELERKIRYAKEEKIKQEEEARKDREEWEKGWKHVEDTLVTIAAQGGSDVAIFEDGKAFLASDEYGQFYIKTDDDKFVMNPATKTAFFDIADEAKKEFFKQRTQKSEKGFIVAEHLNPYAQGSLFPEKETGRKIEPKKTPQTIKRVMIGEQELLMEDLLAPETGEIENVSDTDKDYLAVELKKKGTVEVRGLSIKSPEDLAYICRRLANSAQEKFIVVPLDENNKLLTIDVVSIGILNSSLAHPREVLRSSIALKAKAMILVHNHPSGNAFPSNEDLAVTKQIAESAKFAGIQVLGHLILGAGGSYSHMDENGTVNDEGKIEEKESRKRKTKIPIYEKQVKVSSEKKIALNSPEEVVEIGRKIAGGKSGVWLLSHDSANKLTGAHRLAENFKEMEGSKHKKIVEDLIRNNAASASIYVSMDESEGIEFDAFNTIITKYKDLFKIVGIQFLDVVADRMSQGSFKYGYASAAEKRLMASMRAFWNRLFKGRQPSHGETKEFGIGDIRRFDANHHRWMDADEWRKLHPSEPEKPTGQEELFTPEKKVEMPADEYLDEHKKLVNILRTGTRTQQKAEAKKQEGEVKEQAEKLADQTSTAEFKKWFGNSKVTDKQGKPLVLYHGTAEDFNVFEASKGGVSTGDSERGNPIWFTSSPEAASMFSMLSKMNKPSSKKRLNKIDSEVNELYSKFHANYGKEELRKELLKKIDALIKERDEINSFKEGAAGQNIMPVYLKVKKLYDADKNPDYRFWKKMWEQKKVIGAERLLTPKQKDVVLKAAIEKGYDGVVFRNIQDGHSNRTNVYCVFSPNQIKSAIGNQGTFSSDDPSIVKSR